MCRGEVKGVYCEGPDHGLEEGGGLAREQGAVGQGEGGEVQDRSLHQGGLHLATVREGGVTSVRSRPERLREVREEKGREERMAETWIRVTS